MNFYHRSCLRWIEKSARYAMQERCTTWFMGVEHLGARATVRSQFSVGSACGSEQADAVQVLSNKNAMIAFQNDVKQLAPERR